MTEFKKSYYLKFAVFLTLTLISKGTVRSETLSVLTWEQYISPEVVMNWEKKSNYKVKFIYYDSDAKRDLILAEADELKIDIVVTDSEPLIKGMYDKTIYPIRDLITNSHTIDNKYLEQCSERGIPYFWGTLGIVYRKSAFSDIKPTSWADLFQPDEDLRKKIGMFQDFQETLVGPLKLSGNSISSSDRSALQSAFNILINQSPYVLTYDYIITFLSSADPSKKNLVMALAYSGDEVALNEIEGGGDWEYLVPREGTSLWLDCISVLSRSQIKDVAVDFIDFINETEQAAINSQYLELPSAQKKAREMLKQQDGLDPYFYPEDNTIAKSEYFKEISPDQENQRRKILRAVEKAYETR